MRLRVTTRIEGGATVVQVEGRLVGRGIAVLEKVCRASELPVTLDLSNLWWMDSAGTNSLRTLVREGAQIRSMSPYIEVVFNREKSSEPE